MPRTRAGKGTHGDVVGQFVTVLHKLEGLYAPPLAGDPALVAFIRRLRNSLDGGRVSPDAVIAALESVPRATGEADDAPPKEPRQPFGDFSLDQVERFVADDTVTKAELLALASERFGAPAGTLVRVNRAVLVERIQALVMNERSHESLARLASRDPSAPG